MSHRLQLLLITTLSLGTVAPLAAKDEEESLRKVSFRTQQKMVVHVKTDDELAETTKLLKQIGCEVESEKHDGHVDLKFECRYWQSIKLRTDEEVKQWDAWLTSKGFFVVHNTPGEDHRDTLQYRLEDWNTLHFKTKQENEAYNAMFKMLGCEVKMEKHGDHDDLMIRCPSWTVLGVPNDNEAHAWMGILKKLGFETAHEHAKAVSNANASSTNRR